MMKGHKMNIKDIDDVVDATVNAKISKRVVRFIPIGNVKG